MTLEEKFNIYDAANPHVYVLFKKFANQARSAGRERYGAKAIMERMRWHTNFKTKGDIFKISNNHTRLYAEKLTREDNRFNGFFSIKSKKL